MNTPLYWNTVFTFNSDTLSSPLRPSFRWFWKCLKTEKNDFIFFLSNLIFGLPTINWRNSLFHQQTSLKAFVNRLVEGLFLFIWSLRGRDPFSCLPLGVMVEGEGGVTRKSRRANLMLIFASFVVLNAPCYFLNWNKLPTRRKPIDKNINKHFYKFYFFWKSIKYCFSNCHWRLQIKNSF